MLLSICRFTNALLSVLTYISLCSNWHSTERISDACLLLVCYSSDRLGPDVETGYEDVRGSADVCRNGRRALPSHRTTLPHGRSEPGWRLVRSCDKIGKLTNKNINTVKSFNFRGIKFCGLMTIDMFVNS